MLRELRCTCASLLLKQGVPMKQIQEWLGHSDISTTANIYAHLDSRSKQLSAATMEQTMEQALALPGELPKKPAVKWVNETPGASPWGSGGASEI